MNEVFNVDESSEFLSASSKRHLAPQLSTFDLHDAIVASGLQDLRIEHGRPENAADSVTLFS